MRSDKIHYAKGGTVWFLPFLFVHDQPRKSSKKQKKMHCGANKFRLWCAYSHTAVQINFDCGAIFGVFRAPFGSSRAYI